MIAGVFLVNVIPPHGGGYTFQYEILKSLSGLKSKHRFVIFGDLSHEEVDELEHTDLKYVSLKTNLITRALGRLTSSPIKQLRKLPRAQKRLRSVHANWLEKAIDDQELEMMWFLTPGVIEIELPYIFTVWDLQHRGQPWFPEVSINGEWEKRERSYGKAVRCASMIFVGTETGKQEVVSFYQVPAERVKVLPQPTPDFALKAGRKDLARVPQKYGIGKEYVFYPAQFWPHKNHLALLLALDRLRSTWGLSLDLVLVGSDQGNLQHVRRAAEDLGLSNQVHFLGFVPQEDLVGLYQNAFAMVYPTFFGPDNLPPLEAFALGCPVIAGNVLGAQEQLEDAALLVNPKDEEEIARTVKSLHDDSTLRGTLIERGYRRARKWTAEDYVKSVAEILDDFERIRRCWGKRYP
jgi:glycosyltransferase involved in cell wall biosynthesis